jgi:hypothetical protein
MASVSRREAVAGTRARDRRSGSAALHRPNAHATISENSARHSASPCEAARSLITTSAPASRSATAHRAALLRKNGSSVPATRYVRVRPFWGTPGSGLELL